MPVIILPLLYTILYAGILVIFGMTCLRALSPRQNLADHYPIHALVPTGFLIGQVTLAQVWLFLGISSNFTRQSIWIVLFMSLFLGLLSLKQFYRKLFEEVQGLLTQLLHIGVCWKILCILIVTLLVLLGVEAIMLPPMGDAEAFYMVLPKIMAATGSLLPQPNYYEFSQIGLFGELHYAALMSIGSPQAAKFLTWFTSLALALILLSLCAYAGITLKGCIIASAVLMTSTAFTFSITNGKVDIYGGALGLAAYYWSLRIRHNRDAFPIILTGLLAGSACVAKFSNIPIIICGIGIGVIWNQWLASKKMEDSIGDFLATSFSTLVLIGIGITFALIPHLIKNWALFQEPFAPFFFFAETGSRWIDQTWYSPENVKYILLTYPLAIVFGQYPMQEGNLSVLMFAFMPMILFLPKPASFKNSRLFQISVIALISTSVWIVFRPSILAPRYILAAYLLLIPASARAAEYVFGRPDMSRSLRVFMSAGLIVLLSTFILQNAYIPLRFLKFLAGDLAVCDYASGYCPALEYVNSVAPKGVRIYVGGYHAYHLRPDLLQTISGPPSDLNWKRIPSSKQRWGYLAQEGFRYIVIQKSTHSSYLKDLDSNQVPPGLKVLLQYEDPYSVVYSLQPLDRYGISTYREETFAYFKGTT
jgi:hypothetical protein